YRAPSTPVEEIVASVFGDVLGLERVGADDDFFELGGNSLLATQVTARLGAALDTRVAVRDLFDAATVESLAGRVASAAGSGARPELTAQARPERLPLSLAQQRMWFLNRFDPESAAYNIPVAIRLSGHLDVGSLRAAVADVLSRHEVLRTVYPETADGPVQVILPADGAVPDLTVVPTTEAQVTRVVTDFVQAGFDVTAQVPVRTLLLRIDRDGLDETASDEHVLAMVVHHISADGFSMAPFTRDVMIAYAARTAGQLPGWASLPVQYADYALWQREVLGSENDPDSLIAGQIGYWITALGGLPDQLELPTDRPRPAVQSYHGGRIEFAVSEDLHRGLVDVARGNNATLFMAVHAAFAALLARSSGTEDIAVGTPFAGRGEAALDDLVGMFVNTLVFRTQVAADATFTELLAAVRETDLGAFGNADVPFERLVEVLNPTRSTARHPLCQVGFSFQNLSGGQFELPGLSVAAVDFESEITQYDLHLIVADRYDGDGDPAGMSAAITYSTALFDAGTVQAFADRFVRILEAVVADPAAIVGDVDLLGTAERDRILDGWNATDRPVREATLVDLVDRQVARTPDSTALVFEGETLSYGQFDVRVNRLARRLIAEGVGPETLVGLAIRRSIDLLVGMYAIVKAGGAYVPLDPDHPIERIALVLESAAPALVLTRTQDGLDLGAGVRTLTVDAADLESLDGSPIADADRVAPLRPSHPAYVIFTSGSTGRPKGVAVSHAAVVNQMVWKQSEYPLDARDAVLLKTAATFDLSVWEFWWALQTGARLVIARPDGHQDPGYLLDLMDREAVTTLHVVPSMLSMLLTEADSGFPGTVTRVLAIGEALPAATAARLRRVSSARLDNLYGPTEAAVSVTSYRTSEADTVTVPIGSPEWNTQVYVLDSRLHPVPAGIAGELYLAGAQLARGYYRRADLTADRFVANPFDTAGARMYRTGDVVRWRADLTPEDGTLEYLERADFQVKVRGFRIELGEIESALRARPGVIEAIVVAREDTHLGIQLVGYVVGGDGDRPLDGSTVREGLEGSVPSYMVPAVVMVLDRLPLNVNGKVDRKLLPEPVFEARVFRAPSTPVEEIIAATFADLLGVERVGLDDDFFELGGNSLIATQVVARLGAALEVPVPVRVLFEASTVSDLAARVESQAGVGGRIALVAGPRPERVPLSLAQQRLWFLNRFDPESAAYNIPMAIRLTGRLDIDALQAAVVDVLERHESLRTIYPESDGSAYQLIVPVAQSVPDLAPIEVTSETIAATVAGVMARSFDLTSEVPVRGGIYRLGDAEHVLVLVVHHISADGWSMGPLTRDVMLAYAARTAGTEPTWAALPVQYADFSLWQREVLGSEDDPESVISRQLGYWTEALAGLPSVLELPTDRPRPAVMSGRGVTHEFEIDAELYGALEAVAREHRVTVFMVVHAALAVLLARLSGSSDVAIGTPVAGRGDEALDDLVGMFVNTLVLRTAVEGGESFADLLGRVRETDLAAFAHADLPFERLVDAVNPVRSQSYTPLFQVSLAFQNHASTALELDGLHVSAVDSDVVVARFDLEVIVVDRLVDGAPVGAAVALTYATDLFDGATAARFGAAFLHILRRVGAGTVGELGDLELISAPDREVMLGEWNATAVEVPAGTLVDLIDRSARENGTAPAVTFEGETLSFAEFDSRVNRLARHLIGIGVGPEDRVVVAARRSVEMLVGMYAVMKAGGAYVPVDPDQPVERLAAVLAIAEPVCVLTTERDRVEVPAGVVVVELDRVDLVGLSDGPVSDGDRMRPLRPGNPAYVIFTSGSTGVPKGVAVTHEAIVNQLSWFIGEYAVTPSDVVLQKTPIVFDPSVWELFVPFLAGAHLVIARPDGHRDPDYLVSMSREWGVTLLGFVPSMLATLASGAVSALPPSVRALQLAGEALSPELAARVMGASPVRINNAYGPAETTLTSVHYWCDGTESDSMPIGRPVWNTQAYVLDSRLHPVLPGVAGEVYLAGRQVSRGYHGHPGRTAERFVPNPFGGPGSVMYRTGDLARWRADGQLEYLGRTDFQVKLRGQRIELGEIESALERVGGVSQAVVVLRSDPAVGDRLVGYAVPDPGVALTSSALRERVAESLPGYMVPSTVMVLEAFPLNTSGKLDRKLLPEPVFEVRVFRAPSTPVERVVSAVFGEVLAVEEVGLDDDFFELGGNSLIATQVVARLGAALDTQVPVRMLFEASTVAELAGLVEAHAGAGGRVALRAGERPDRIPLSLAQARMWFLNRFAPESTAYNIPLAVRLTGVLKVAALQAAVGDVLERHESLRTMYPESDEGPRQVIVPSAEVTLDLEPRSIPNVDMLAAAAEFLSEGFDVRVAPPVRARLFEVSDTERVLVMVVHHITADGLSMAPLARDVMVAYAARAEGAAPAWAPLPVQYADYTVWQHRMLGSLDDENSLAAQQLKFWRSELAALPDALDLPADRPRPAEQSMRGARYDFALDEGTTAAIRECAAAHGATPFMVLHTALAVLLARLSGTSDIVIGTPVAGRGEAALDDLVGMFVNTLVLRTEVDASASFADLLGVVRSTDVRAFGHMDVPFEQLVDALNPARSKAHNPLFQVSLSLQNQEQAVLELPGLTVGALDTDVEVTQFDLSLTLGDQMDAHGAADGMYACFVYATDLFDESTIAAFASQFVRIVEAVVADAAAVVGDIRMVNRQEAQTWLARATGETVPGNGGLLLDDFEAQVARTPDAIALADDTRRMTYREFDARVNRIARVLIARGVRPEATVAIAMRRSLDLFVAIYAVLKAGGAYLPVDPDQSGTRNEFVLEAATPLLVLTSAADRADLPPTEAEVVEIDCLDTAGVRGEQIDPSERIGVLRPGNAAYVFFTSGSTGRPKGVVVSHDAITGHLRWMRDRASMTNADVVLHKAVETFDIAVWECFGGLQSGGRVVVARADGHRDARYLADLMARERVTVAHFVPSMLDLFLGSDGVALPDSLRFVFVGGEAISIDLARSAATRGLSVHNSYGPTEVTVTATWFDHAGRARGAVVPMGGPAWNTRAYVLDSRLHPVPIGVAGELYLAGEQVARGYLGRPDLTADRFVADPFGTVGDRMYRTGDRVRWNGEGDLEFLGRTDFQIKLRGQRIEPGEIEAVLRRHPAVAQAVVVAHADERTGMQLVGYVVASDGMEVGSAELRAYLDTSLPRFMVPSAIVGIDQLPLNAAGKLDRRALPAPRFETSTDAYVAPRTPVEAFVADAFADVVGIEQVGATDSFFELGGHSLLAVRVVARLNARFGVDLGVRVIFDAPTVAALAEVVERSGLAADRPALAARPRPDLIPLSLAQQRMWFLNQFDTESALYNIPAAVRLSGQLDVGALRAAVGDVLARHEVLRTRYPSVDGTGSQQVLPVGAFTLDLTPETIPAADTITRVTEVVTAGFDVTTQVPVRARLFAVADTDDHVLVLVVHHIAGDGVSMGPLTRDVMLAYAARGAGSAPDWAPLTVQYADYSLWQHEVLGSEHDPASLISRQLSHWTTALDGLPDQLELPTDRPRPAVATNSGAVVSFTLDASLHRGLGDLARTHNSTMFMVLHTALAVLLARLSGTSDIAIGTPIAGRGDAALDELVGMFVNTLVLRTPAEPSTTFADLLEQARETDLSAFANADVPFERLVEVLSPTRSQSRNPLFQVAIAMQNTGPVEFELPGLSLSGVDFDGHVAKFDLQLAIMESFTEDGVADGIAAEFLYATDLFNEQTVVRFAERLVSIAHAAVAAPSTAIGDIDLLTPAELVELSSRRGADAGPVRTLPEVLAAAARMHPSAPAVTLEGRTLTYREIDEWSSRVARVLIAEGVGPESFIALGITRSIESVLAVWSVAKTGAAFVPVDPNYPADRVAHMASDSGARIGLTVSASVDRLPGSVRWLVLDDLDFAARCRVQPAGEVDASERRGALRVENTAYVIYTSGSTGKPKGVAVTHGGLSNLADEQRDRFGIDADSRTLHFASPSFDASMLELLLAVGAGATMVIVPTTIYGGAELGELIRDERVSHVFITPAALASIDPAQVPELRSVMVGGEAYSPDLVARWAADRAFFNVYGPTETTILATSSDPLTPGGPMPIGEGLRGVRTLVLDGRLHPVPVGVAGELYLSGPGVARGYLDRPGLTADRFVANPFAADGALAGDRMYRTGDVVRWTDAGELDYVSRADFQVKVRGFRIELGEIDLALTAHDDVDFATTIGHTAGGSTSLVSYVVAVPGRVLDPSALKEFVGRSLAAHMVPASIMVLDEIPLNPVGKLDRKALPEPVFEAREFRAPSTPVEQIVANAYAEVLGATRVGLDDDFFELGGNSLIATQVTARLGAALDATVPVRLMFEASTVAELAVRVGQLAGHGGRPALRPGDRPEQLPLSLAQQRMWFLNRFDPESVAYNIPSAIRLTGHLDVAALQAAVGDVMARHEVLRTVYPQAEDGTATQVILPIGDVVVDLDPVVVPADRVVAEVTAFVSAGFDVTAHVPIRALLVRVDGTDANPEHVLALVVHHIAADGSSIGPFTRDLMVAYASRAADTVPPQQPLPVQYADYALWQREVLGSEDDPASLISAQLDYWRTALAGLPDQLDLPTNRPRPAVQSYHGGTIEFAVSAELHRGLAAIARGNNATLFMVVHAAFATLLARLSGTRDIAVGTPFAGRGDAALDDLIGMFVNTLVFRTDVAPDASFTELLALVREADLGAFGNADVPFERLVEVLNPTRSTARHPLCQVGFSFQNLAEATFELDGLEIAPAELASEVSQFDLHLIIGDRYDEQGTPIGLGANLTYATALFDRGTAQAFADRFLGILERVVADPDGTVGDLPMVTAAESEQILGDWNATDESVPDATLVDLFAAQATRTPDEVALVFEEQTLTYREFAARVNRLARRLIEEGVGPEAPVGLAMRRSVELMVGMYAIVTAGGAYVPIDPDHPGDRIALILESAAPALVLTRTADAVALPDDVRSLAVDTLDLSGIPDAPVDDRDRVAPLRTGNPAYVIFTSGSTGRPKGVAVSHAAVVNQMVWKQEEYGLGGTDAVLLKTAATFDLSVWEFWWALQTGARLVIARPDGHRDPAYLLDLMTRESVTTLHVVPSMLSMLLADQQHRFPESVTRVLAIGEALPADTAARLRAVSGARLDNLYGPTEAAVSVTSYRTSEADAATVPIGRPEWNTQVFVLDGRLHPVPVGVPGELYLAGTQLARGYHGRTDLTADRFVANPFGDGTRLYRTGDVVRWRADGNLDYLERADFQVKVRGYRIELGEIESALRSLTGVNDAVVVARGDALGGTRLVGYVVGSGLDGAHVRGALSGAVPSYMVPAAVLVLDALPLNVNGKVDRAALPDPEFAPREFRAPATDTQRAVAAVFAEVLGLERVGLDDDFFELGGNSLVATRLTALLGAELGVEVPVLWVFSGPTVESIASRADAVLAGVEDVDADAAFGILLPLREQGTKPPLFCIHPVIGLSWAFGGLSAHVDRERAIYGLQSPAISGAEPLPATIEDWAARYLREIRTVQPEGPYHLIGWSLGGVIAHAMAAQLQADGGEVALLAMMDSYADNDIERPAAARGMTARDLVGGLLPSLASGGERVDEDLTADLVHELVADLPAPFGSFGADRIAAALAAAGASIEMIGEYDPRPYKGDLLYFAACGDDPTGEIGASTWRAAVDGRIATHRIEATHWEMASPESLARIGAALEEWWSADGER
ncbi:non-ribosomal peptide synthase/polyketide synthase, partial [Rhodococcus sp. NPDC058505]|uniref:non-ribosomal peptide synthase/polyketide synthase n=1 Tax=Rhodococcus sp. NPDC058505 TaxID=3346531 RepID=UPI0036496EA7